MTKGLRLIGGEFGSRLIQTPKGEETRPTRGMVREAVFNLLGPGAVSGFVLDLFAGSGALGFEALSRGAEKAVFCDLDPEAIRVLRLNAKTLKAEDRCEVWGMDYRLALSKLKGAKFRLVFLDPPYKIDYTHLIQTVYQADILDAGAVMVVEHSSKMTTELPDGLRILKNRSYGENGITIITNG